MNSRDFAYWLQGFFEVAEPAEMNSKQTELIKKHLAMVFYHEIDPSFKEDQPALQEIHSPTKTVTTAVRDLTGVGFWDPLSKPQVNC